MNSLKRKTTIQSVMDSKQNYKNMFKISKNSILNINKKHEFKW